MGEFLAALPIIKQALDLVNLSIKGVRWLFWKIGIIRLENKKEDINDADSPKDWSNILKR